MCSSDLHEAIWPVRYGATAVGAVWCHWSMGVPLLAQDVDHLLGLAATAVAPALYQAAERLRTPVPPRLVPELVGDSRAMLDVRDAVVRAAASPFPVLIEGESGVGKELVARAIHASSVRRARTWCALNCAAIADELVEAELFGHARGAFTGAVAERVGLFEEAQGGTVFLDEVAELSPRVQAKLLRTIQEVGVNHVVTTTFERPHLPAGITTRWVPFVDLDLPLNMEPLYRAGREVAEKVRDGQRVYVHCGHGYDRSGLVMALALRELYPALTGEQVLAMIQIGRAHV